MKNVITKILFSFALIIWAVCVNNNSFANAISNSKVEKLGGEYRDIVNYLENKRGFKCEYLDTDEWSLCSFHGGMCKYGKPHYICKKNVEPSSLQKLFGVQNIIEKVTLKEDYILKIGIAYNVNENIKTIKIYKKFNYKNHKNDFENASEAIIAIYPIGSDSNELRKVLEKQNFFCLSTKKDNNSAIHCIRDIRTAGNLFMPWIRIGVSIYKDNMDKIKTIATSSEYTGL